MKNTIFVIILAIGILTSVAITPWIAAFVKSQWVESERWYCNKVGGQMVYYPEFYGIDSSTECVTVPLDTK